MNPKESVQKLAQEVMKDHDTLWSPQNFEWWRTFLLRWTALKKRCSAVADLPPEVKDSVENAVTDVDSAVAAYVEPEIRALRGTIDAPQLRSALARLSNQLTVLLNRTDWPVEPRAAVAPVFTGDPRMAEVELLRRLELEGTQTHQLDRLDTAHVGGLPVQAFRELLVDLLFRGMLNGPATLNVGRPVPMDLVGSIYDNGRDISNLMEGKAIEIRLNHRGRVHLWQQRDALLLNRDREDLGVLWNRRAWDLALPLSLLWASADNPIAVLMLDLDHFKRVNDDHGHAKGDDVLRSAFTVVRSMVPSPGEAYRYGGEEMGVILPKTSAERATSIAESIRVAIEKEVMRDAELPAAQTVSIGVGCFMSAADARSAVEFADSQLYKAKQEGRNCVVTAQWETRNDAAASG